MTGIEIRIWDWGLGIGIGDWDWGLMIGIEDWDLGLRLDWGFRLGLEIKIGIGDLD